MTRFSGSDATSAFCRYRTPTDAGLPLDGLPDLCLGGEPRLRRRHRSTMCYTCAPLSAKGGREVKIDVGLRSDDLHALGREAAAYERLGADGLWGFDTERERTAAERHARQQIAFYASTPTYRPFLAYHGFEALGQELSGLARAGRFADMPAQVPDALLDAVAVSAGPDGLSEAIRARYAGDLIQRVSPYAPILPHDPGGRFAALVAGIKSA